MTIDSRLAIPAASAWISAAVVIGVPGVALPLAVALWLVAAAALAAALLSPRTWLVIAALAVVAAALSSTSIALRAAERQPAALVEVADSGRAVTVLATTTATVLPGTVLPGTGPPGTGLPGTGLPGSGPYPLQLTRVEFGGHSVVGSIPVLVFGERPASRVGIGATVELSGTLTTARAGDDIAFLLFPDSAPAVLAGPPWFLDWANGLRASFLAVADSLPGEGGDLLAGLAIGDTSAVSAELNTAMKTSSLSHLTAVSGANCAIVIGLIMAAGARLGMPRAARIGVSVAVLLAFVVLVTPEPSVLRAAVMAALVLVALLGGRPVRGVPVLALATLSLLVIDPWLARNYGFVLSVLATAGLLLLAGPLARVLGRWLPDWLAIAIAVPLAAQLACQPVIILLNASLPTYGVIANLLAAPAAPIATVVGLAACVALAVFPPLGVLLCQVAWLPSAWIAAGAQFFSRMPAARLPWPDGPLGVGLLALVTTLALLALFWRGPRRRWLALGLALCVVAYTVIAGGSRLASQLGRPADWQIAACDVGQGDAVVVRSAGRVALIDTGPAPKLLAACLGELGIQRIDLLVLSHFDRDHVGGTAAVIGAVDRVFVGPSGDAGDDRLRADLVAGGAALDQVSRGASGLLGDLRWQVLWPPKRLLGIEPGNPASVTVEFQPVGDCAGGCLSALLLGDLGERAQQLLLAANPVGEVDVVKVAHHGSADQSEQLYQRLGAVVGLIGVGADNGYGHPTSRLLEILGRVGTAPQRTDRDGLILLAPGDAPGTVRAWTAR